MAPKEPKWSLKEQNLISNSIENMLKSGALSKVQASKSQFLSKYFLIPKKDGTFRFILNLKNLNQYIKTSHFKLEDHRVVARLLDRNYFMAKIDLREAYFLVPVHESYKKYLRFSFNGNLYEYNCLCFGINCAPMIFTKLLKPVMYYLRKKGFLSVLYLDDFLLLSDSYRKCKLNVSQTISVLERLGFIINYDKSLLIPNNTCVYLGFEFNSIDLTISVPNDKRNKLIQMLQDFKKLKHCKIRDFSKIIGKLVSVCPAIKYGYLYSKLFEREKYLALKISRGNYNDSMQIPHCLNNDLNWWIKNLKNNTNFLKRGSFVKEIFSDASNTGWGLFCNGYSSHGFWSEKEKTQHINYLELLAVFFGLKCYAKDLKNCFILCRVDNTTAIAYINRMGSVQFPKLNSLARTIWQWCESRNIYILASYIRSSDNVVADKASRKVHVDTEWALANSKFQKIIKRFGPPDIDLFASRVNKKCNVYVSWLHDPDASAIDAFTLNWSRFFFYAFPPFSIILRTLEKIIADQAEGILVVPMWPSQPWYPIFLSLLVKEPLIFKPKPNLVSFGRLQHPLSEHLSLMGGLLSGKRCNKDKFRNHH